MSITTPSKALTITNAKNTGGFLLPLTGGTGTVLITVVGVLGLAAIVAFVVVRRRREHATE